MLTAFQYRYLEAAQAGLEPDWQSVTDLLRAEIGGDICSVVLMYKSGTTEVLAESVPDGVSATHYREANHSGLACSSANPYYASAMQTHRDRNVPLVSYGDLIMPFTELRTTPFYQRILAPAGFNDAIGGLMFHEGHVIGKISLLRNSGARRYNADDAAKLGEIAKFATGGLVRSHLSRKLQMSNVAISHSRRATEMGAIIFDCRGNVVDGAGIGSDVWNRHAARFQKIVKDISCNTIAGCEFPKGDANIRLNLQGSVDHDGHPVQFYFEPSLVAGRNRLFCYLRRTKGTSGDFYRIPENVHLTRREVDIVRLLVRGLDNASIARDLEISVYTVKDHLKSLYSKLSVNRRAAAVALLTRGIRTAARA
jgi:DNA-binding CsgD family transcriptional regulator